MMAKSPEHSDENAGRHPQKPEKRVPKLPDPDDSAIIFSPALSKKPPSTPNKPSESKAIPESPKPVVTIREPWPERPTAPRWPLVVAGVVLALVLVAVAWNASNRSTRDSDGVDRTKTRRQAKSKQTRKSGSPNQVDGTHSSESDSASKPGSATAASGNGLTKSESDSNPDPAAEESVALQNLPETIDGLMELAATLFREQKQKQAIAVLKKGSSLFPRELRPDFCLGLIFSGLGDSDSRMAEIHFKRVLDRWPRQTAACNNLALTHIKARRVAPARNYLAIASKSDPRPREVDHNLGRMLKNPGSFEIKPEDLKRINSLNPKSEGFDSHIGWLYMPLDETAQSLAEALTFSKNGALEDRSCCYCNGRASMACKACYGRGTVPPISVHAEKKEPSSSRKKGAKPAPKTVPCAVCKGVGRVDCQNCQDGTDASLQVENPAK